MSRKIWESLAKYLLVVLLAGGFGFKATAQYAAVGVPAVTHFTTKDYKAGTQNWSLLQDEKGVLYVGNNKGLLEFDGKTWNLFRLPNHTIVRSLAFGQEGRLYLGSQDDFGYLTATTDWEITYHSLVHLLPESLRSFEDVWKVFALEGTVYFCTQEAIFRYKNDRIDPIQPKGIFSHFFEWEGRLFVRDIGFGLMEIEDNVLLPVAGGEQFAEAEITALLPSEGGALIVSAKKGLFRMSKSGISYWDVPASDFIKQHPAYCALQLSNGQYAIGTTQNGLLVIDQAGFLTLHFNQESGLQNNTVLSLYEDHHQNLFLGLDNGLDYVELNPPFSYIRSESGVEGTGYAAAYYQDKLYLGTNQGLFAADWGKRGPTGEVAFQLVPNTEGQVWSLQQVDDFLVVGQHKAAQVMQNGRAVPFSKVQGAWKFLPLSQNPQYAVEGTYSGLILYQKQADANGAFPWKSIGKLAGFDESARVMEEDASGNLWVSHAYKGVYKIELDLDKRAIKDVSFYNTSDGLPADIAINVAKIRGELLFTTTSGVYFFDEATRTFKPHEELNEVFGASRTIHRLLEDQLGNVWFSVEEEFGVLRVQEKGLYNELDQQFFNHIHEELMDGYEHVFAIDKDHIFITTEQGFIHYHPSSYDNATVPEFNVLIRTVTAIADHDSTLYKGYFQTESLTIDPNTSDRFPYRMNDFRFVFSAPFFEQLDEVRYRFKLEGFEEEWSDWLPQGEKEYTNLPAGNYRFVVEARNAYGEVSNSSAYPFVIRPPWYASVAARFGYAVLFTAGIVILLGLNGRRWRRQTEELKTKQARALEEKREEYEQKVERTEAEIIRLRNEKLVSDLTLKNSKLASATMHLVQKGEILQKIKRDLKKIKAKASEANQDPIRRLIRAIDEDMNVDDHWDQFGLYFDEVHENFLKRLREEYPVLTPKDQKLCAYLRMNLSTKEIAPLMNISVRGIEISRYRLRKKLELDSDTNLNDFMMRI